VLDQKRILGLCQDVNDGVADRRHVESLIHG
jgi:hypothetical protein